MINDNTYGSVEGVALLARPFTNSEERFDGDTVPTLEQVESYINQVSGIINFILASKGITIPIAETYTDIHQMLDYFVNELVSKSVKQHKSFTRGGKNPKSSTGLNYYDVIGAFLEEHAIAFDVIGLGRDRKYATGVAFPDTDEDENLFKREQWGYEP